MIQLIYDEEDDRYVGNLLRFSENHDGSFTIINDSEDKLGHLEKLRVGAWMSWCLLLEGGCYLSAGCQDEVREMTKRLNAKLHKKDTSSEKEVGRKKK